MERFSALLRINQIHGIGIVAVQGFKNKLELAAVTQGQIRFIHGEIDHGESQLFEPGRHGRLVGRDIGGNVFVFVVPAPVKC